MGRLSNYLAELAGLAVLVAVSGLGSGCQNLFFDPVSVPLRSGNGAETGGTGDPVDGGGPSDLDSGRPADATTKPSGDGYSLDGGEAWDTAVGEDTPVSGGADSGSMSDTDTVGDTGRIDPRDTGPGKLDTSGGGQDTADTGQPPPSNPYACYRAVSCISLNCTNYGTGCTQTYHAMVSAGRRHDLLNFVGCLRSRSCDFIAKPACVDSKCAPSRNRCLEDAPASGQIDSCAGFFRCAEACGPNDAACYKSCRTRLGFLAQRSYDDFASCLRRKCATADARTACARKRCKAPYEACMDCP